MADYIEKSYKEFYGVEKIPVEQLIESIIDSESKIGGSFKLIEKRPDILIFKNTKCPFSDDVRKCPVMCTFTSTFFGTMCSKAFGNCTVKLTKTIAKGDGYCYVECIIRN